MFGRADVAGAADGVVRAVVAPLPGAFRFAVVDGALHDAPANAKQTIYDVGPTRVGFLSCAPGNFIVAERKTTECFFVVDGAFFLTNPDGSARRCTAGDVCAAGFEPRHRAALNPLVTRWHPLLADGRAAQGLVGPLEHHRAREQSVGRGVVNSSGARELKKRCGCELQFS